MTLVDPRVFVEAPIRRALGRVILAGTLLFAAAAAAGTCAGLGWLDHATHLALASLVVGLLFGYVLVIQVVRRVHDRPSADARAIAWTRAREVDEGDARLARVVAAGAPAIIALTLVEVAARNVADPIDGGAFAAIGLPALALAWGLATITWVEECRDAMARAAGSADARFRAHWAAVGDRGTRG